MDDDSYATMGDDYKIIEDDNRQTHTYFLSQDTIVIANKKIAKYFIILILKIGNRFYCQ